MPILVYTEDGNCLMSRSLLICIVVSMLGGTWMVEQPCSSRIVWFPGFEQIVRRLRIFRVGWWARHYGSLSPMLGSIGAVATFQRSTCVRSQLPHLRKRHRGFSNSSQIHHLDRGTLNKAAMLRCTLKTTKKTKKKDGTVSYCGTGHLKKTQPNAQT